MNTKAKLTLCLAVLLASLGWLLLQTEPGEATEPLAGSVGSVTLEGNEEELELAQNLKPGGDRVEGAVETSSTDVATQESEVPRVPAKKLLLIANARIIDGRGRPIEGATLTAADLKEPVSATSDAKGDVRLEVAWPMELAEGNPSWSVVEATGLGWTNVRMQRRIHGPETVEFGDITLEAAGEIHGRVVDEAGSPLQGAMVRTVGGTTPGTPEVEALRRLRGRSFPNLGWGGSWTQTAEDGSYHLAKAPARSVSVVAGSRGKYFRYTAPLDVPHGGAAQAPDLVLDPVDASAYIRGIVVDENGPVQGAKVKAFENRSRRNTNAEAGPVRTDVEGRFRLKAVPGTKWTLEAQHASEGRPFMVVHDVGHGPGEARIEFPAVRTFRVNATGPDGAPVPQVHIQLLESPFPTSVSQTTGRLSDGAFGFALPNIPFVVQAKARGYKAATAGPFEPGTAPESVSLPMEPAAAIRGTVTAAGGTAAGVALRGARVHLHSRPKFSKTERFDDGLRTRWASHYGRPKSVATDADGRFEIFVEGDGPFLLHVDAEGYARGEVGPIEAPADGTQSSPDLAIELDEGATLTGRVLVSEGIDPEGVTVAISHGDGHVLLTNAAADGAYRFERLTPGPWQVRRGSPENLEWLRSSRTYPDSGDAPEIQADVELEADVAATYDLDFTSEEPCTVSGWLALDGAWEPGWSLLFYQENRRMNGAVDRDGHFQATFLGSGEATLTFYSTASTGEKRRLTRQVPLKAGSSEMRWSALSGSVRLSNIPEPASSHTGDNLHGYALVQTSADGWSWSVSFDPSSSGTWTFNGVPSGRVELRRRQRKRNWSVLTWPVIGSFDVGAGEQIEFQVPGK